MTGRTETWFDDHPEREQIAAVLIDYFLNGLGLEWIEQQLERFSSGALWYESGHAGTLLYGWMAGSVSDQGVGGFGKVPPHPLCEWPAN